MFVIGSVRKIWPAGATFVEKSVALSSCIAVPQPTGGAVARVCNGVIASAYTWLAIAMPAHVTHRLTPEVIEALISLACGRGILFATTPTFPEGNIGAHHAPPLSILFRGSEYNFHRQPPIQVVRAEGVPAPLGLFTDLIITTGVLYG